MKCISIYNNKGGVGKSTVTLFLADFFASLRIGKRNARVLAIDMDAQNSCSTALLGLNEVHSAKQDSQTVSMLLCNLFEKKKQALTKYLLTRPLTKTKGRAKPLYELGVMVSERDSMIAFENNCSESRCLSLAKTLRTGLEKSFDVVFIDLPANIDQRNRMSHLGLCMSDFVLIPVEPTRIAINSLEDTFRLLDYTSKIGNKKSAAPNIAGLLLNKTDKRTNQYRLHQADLASIAEENQSVIFKNFLPNSPNLSKASDDSLSFASLKERYTNNYEHVRLVSMELAKAIGMMK